ncbi:putative serine protease K12H4.7 [Ochlerotatus camptorhynchus]|uniref:putative serine protease K12H4.7 n=1 Tax=Ochlerotatus camptorhynchus TaxID=644619 RepID=UPI0031D3098A
MITRAVVLLAGLLAVASGMVREAWFETSVDHFNPRNQDKFDMRYYSNDEHAYAKGPIFVIVGSNGPIETRYLSEGLFYDIAYLEGAYIFANEHRYFGHSLPVADATSEKMDFLTVDQALADLAAWIHHLKHDVVGNPDAKVILMGYGYGGSLATWFHQQFPHLTNGVWASSGPMEAEFDLAGYMESLGETIGEFGGRDCYGTIFSGFRVVQNMITLDRTDLLTELFDLCSAVDTDNRLDTTAFLLGLQRDIEDEIMHLRHTQSTTEMCEVIENTDDDIENSLLALSNWFLREHQFEECVDLGFNHFMAPYLETDFDADYLQKGYRQRLYLQCTATGFFATTESFYQPFGDQIDNDFYVEVCRHAFGDWINEEIIRNQVDRTNVRFGGKQPEVVNVHFTHGDIDPMMVTGIVEDLNKEAVATVVPNAFHAPDLESIDYMYDSPELIAAKETTRNLIDSWIFLDFDPIHEV